MRTGQAALVRRGDFLVKRNEDACPTRRNPLQTPEIAVEACWIYDSTIVIYLVHASIEDAPETV